MAQLLSLTTLSLSLCSLGLVALVELLVLLELPQCLLQGFQLPQLRGDLHRGPESCTLPLTLPLTPGPLALSLRSPQKEL